MVYLQLLLGLGCVVAAAGLAIYYMSNTVPPEPPHSRSGRDRRRSQCQHDFNHTNHQLVQDRPSKPGDLCIICQEEMTRDNMRMMHCGHAVHSDGCYEDHRKFRRNCLICGSLVFRITLPGTNCVICQESMAESDMEYLKCEHALHKGCLAAYKGQKYMACPLCKKSL
ncbi:uncharacterized protein LOC108603588 [Drosophila busckii]|uniref:uncharacterized protein LOC108603588 n=1 Tax=Drosophila busckii TaxID=30019 RepID=UPI00083E964C|nr:uncharacterized protein LOC108603588 [Drosophila busckii]